MRKFMIYILAFILGVVCVLFLLGIPFHSLAFASPIGSSPKLEKPLYDATGVWYLEMKETSNKCHINNLKICNMCAESKLLLRKGFSLYKTVKIIQTGKSFSAVFKQDKRRGVVSGNRYTYHRKSIATSGGVTATMTDDTTIVLDDTMCFTGTTEFNVFIQYFGHVCTVVINFEGIRKNVH